MTAADPWAQLAKTDRPDLDREVRARWKRMLEEDPNSVLEDPVLVTVAFLNELAAGPGREDRLTVLVEPETVDEWGDFSDARALLDTIRDWAVPTQPHPGPTPDVVWVYLLPDVQTAFVSDEDQIAIVPAVVWLRRREGEWWRVVGFGSAPIAV